MVTGARDQEFEEAVQKAFAFVSHARPPEVVRSIYDPEAFGNAIVELCGEQLRVRVVRDRSQIVVELAPLGHDEWFDEHLVLESVGVIADTKLTLDSSATAIGRHFSAIVRSFDKGNWESTRQELTARRERRGQQFAEHLRELAQAHHAGKGRP
jgi:hypothetical protein